MKKLRFNFPLKKGIFCCLAEISRQNKNAAHTGDAKGVIRVTLKKKGVIENNATSENESKNVRLIIANMIEDFRLANELSRAELAVRVGVSEAAIGQYERAERTPSIETLIKLSEVFQIPVDSLVTGHLDNWWADAELLKRIGFGVEEESGTIYVHSLFTPPRNIDPEHDHYIDFDDGTNIRINVAEPALVARFSSYQDFHRFVGFIRDVLCTATGTKHFVSKLFIKYMSREEIEVPEIVLLEQADISRRYFWKK